MSACGGADEPPDGVKICTACGRRFNDLVTMATRCHECRRIRDKAQARLD